MCLIVQAQNFVTSQRHAFSDFLRQMYGDQSGQHPTKLPSLAPIKMPVEPTPILLSPRALRVLGKRFGMFREMPGVKQNMVGQTSRDAVKEMTMRRETRGWRKAGWTQMIGTTMRR